MALGHSRRAIRRVFHTPVLSVITAFLLLVLSVGCGDDAPSPSGQSGQPSQADQLDQQSDIDQPGAPDEMEPDDQLDQSDLPADPGDEDSAMKSNVAAQIGAYERDPAVYSQKGIQNCHGYTWWQLTGSPQNSKSLTQVEQELARRGYRAFLYDATITLKSGDVVTFVGTGVNHSGIVLHEGKVSHLRSTAIQDLIRTSGSLPSGDLLPTGRLIIVDPNDLYSYPQDYKQWLIDHSSDKRFSTGVPVMAMRFRAERLRMACVCLARGFLMFWASSRMTSPHWTLARSFTSRRARP